MIDRILDGLVSTQGIAACLLGVFCLYLMWQLERARDWRDKSDGARADDMKVVMLERASADKEMAVALTQLQGVLEKFGDSLERIERKIP